MKSILVVVLSLFTFIGSGSAAMLFERSAANWRWRPGNTEASTPIEAWRALSFNDAQFVNAPAPFWIADVLPGGGTQISGMINVYTCIFLRKTFVITNVE